MIQRVTCNEMANWNWNTSYEFYIVQKQMKYESTLIQYSHLFEVILSFPDIFSDCYLLFNPLAFLNPFPATELILHPLKTS